MGYEPPFFSMIVPTKISDAPAGSFISPEYSSISPFSKGNAYLLLIAFDHFQLFTGAGKFVKDLPIGASERPRWSRRNAGQLTYLRGNQVVIYDVAIEILHSYIFSEYVFLDDYGEADQQLDSRVLVGTREDVTKEIFVFDVTGGTKGPVLPTTGPFNNVLLCPDQRQVLVNGRLLLDPETKVARMVFDGADGHKAVTRFKGRDVLIITDDRDNGIYMVHLDTGLKVLVLALPWDQEHRERDLAVHISAPADAGFCLVSTYAPEAPAYQDGLHNAILKVSLDGSGAEVLCYHNSDSSTYEGQPKASISQDGSRFVYASNGGVKDGPVDTWLGVLVEPEPPKPPVVWPGHPYPGELERGRWWGQFWHMLMRLFGVRV